MRCVLGLLFVVLLTRSGFAWQDQAKPEPAKMVLQNLQSRLTAANQRESQSFAQVQNREQWEAYRTPRLLSLKASLGAWPEPPKPLRMEVTKTISGDGFLIHNLLYESRWQQWVSANLYLPNRPPESMPGLLIAHSHHTSKSDGELQDMGMTWAKAGCAVLVPDQFGYGERRLHGFNSANDFAKPFRVGRQDYWFRYNSNLMLSAQGESLMGIMVWDLMRGVDVLLAQPKIDPKRIILLGSVAGGGDPAGVTAALDSRIACVVPFNFGGWQPESRELANPDRDFAWFGDGYWESTRGLKNGARDGFAHFVIVGSVAPRRVIYAHEFGWDPDSDPAWPRLRKIFGFYDAADSLRVGHGAGSVRASGPGNTHCNHIGAIHRKMIYPALRDWFQMTVPQEYSQRRPTEELRCWTEVARHKLKPQPLAFPIAPAPLDLRDSWMNQLGPVEANKMATVSSGGSRQALSGQLTEYSGQVEPGIVLKFDWIQPERQPVERRPVVVMFAQAGKERLRQERPELIEMAIKQGVSVLLVDVRGTGASQPGSSASRTSSRTTVSQISLMLAQPLLGAQLRDLRTVLHWLRQQPSVDTKKIGLWADSFAKTNPTGRDIRRPQDANDDIRIAEPGADLLALLTRLFEPEPLAVATIGGWNGDSLDVFFAVPHDAVVPGVLHPLGGTIALANVLKTVQREALVNSQNQLTSDKRLSPAQLADWLLKHLK